MNLMTDIKIKKVAAAEVSAGTEITSDIVDTQGYEGVVFFTTIDKFNAGNYMKVQQDTDAAGGTMADLAGSKVISTQDAQVLWVEISKPMERYLRCKIVRAGLNTALGEIYALLYGAHTKPEDNAPTTKTEVGEIHASPAEGTA